MDSIFHLVDAERTNFLRHMMHSFGSSYICLWSFSPLPSNCLLFLDGFYQIQQPSSSSGSGSLAARLFDAYCGSGNYIDNGRAPGFAFRNNVPYLEMQADHLHTMVSTEIQLQFYQEAGIKTAVFMGCSSGEIELGFSIHPPVNLQMEIQSWFPSDFCKEIPQSSSSFGSLLSGESIKYFDISNSTFNTDESLSLQESISMAMSSIPNHQSTLIPNLQFPEMETTDLHHAALSSSPQNQHAFTSYRSVLAPKSHKPNSLKKAVSFFKTLDMTRKHELQMIQENQPTINQIHHMIAERRRREKVNESFRILRTLLPQVTKKDKASVLSSTTEYMNSLKSQLGELARRNVALETQLSKAKRGIGEEREIGHLSPSTSEPRFLDLRMSCTSEDGGLTDFVSRVLGFLKQKGNVSLLSVQSSTRFVESAPVHSLLIRFKAEGNEFDETGFQEAVRRVVDDLPH